MKRLLLLTSIVALLTTFNASALTYDWGYVFDSGWEIHGTLEGDPTGPNGSLVNLHDASWNITNPSGIVSGPFFDPTVIAADLIPDAGLPPQFRVGSVDISYMKFTVDLDGTAYNLQVEMDTYRGVPGDIAGDVIANDSWYLTRAVPDSGSTLLMAFAGFAGVVFLRRLTVWPTLQLRAAPTSRLPLEVLAQMECLLPVAWTITPRPPPAVHHTETCSTYEDPSL